MDILKHFPLPTFREHQQEAILEIDKAFKDGKKYVVVEAPTGSGKSPIAATFANQAGTGAHILTVQHILQDQYERDFPTYGCQKGKGAYTCVQDGNSCAEGICNRLPKERKQELMADCPYRQSIVINRAKPVVVHNFDGYYYQQCLAHQFPEKELLIIDEAHNIEDKFIDFFSFTLRSNSPMRPKDSVKFPIFKQVDEYLTLIKDERQKLAKRLYDLIADEEVELDPTTYKLTENMRRMLTKLDAFVHKCQNNEYVFDIIDLDDSNSITFRPVFAGGFIEDVLFNGPKRVLMMSATILDKDMFCNSIGLDPDEVAYISIPSTFPVKNRPIITRYAGSMAFREISETLPLMVGVVEEIVRKHAKRRGIVHTSSERVAEYIRREVSQDVLMRLTFRRDYVTVPEMLRVHERLENSVIVASGLKEGVDLKDDLSRFQIICKVPYLDLSDKRTKRRMTIEKRWYGYSAAKLFIQSVGRSVRSPKDKAITYITDSSFVKFYNMNRRFIPEYIRDALYL